MGLEPSDPAIAIAEGVNPGQSVMGGRGGDEAVGREDIPRRVEGLESREELVERGVVRRHMLADEIAPMPGQPGVYKSPKAAGLCTGAMFLYVPDVDAAFSRALKSGCSVRTPVTDMFWGDRYGQVIDPFGHTWGLATHTEDVSMKDMEKRQQEFMAKMAQAS